MSKTIRLFLAFAILLSGLALIPFVNLPTEGFTWQQFAGGYIYDPTPTPTEPPPPPFTILYLPILTNQ